MHDKTRSQRPRLRNFRVAKTPIYAKNLLRRARSPYHQVGPRAFLQKIRRGLFRDYRGAWQLGKAHELVFWREALREGNDSWPPGVLEFRLDPDSQLQPELVELLANCTGRNPRVLDVGCGPLISLGKKLGDRSIDIVAIDPLADDYAAVFEGSPYKPIVPPRKICGEDIPSHFEENSFDLCHARNSLDHAYDPVSIIRHMVWCVKPGCSVFLDHLVNEAENNRYKGFHQWNFYLHEGDFMVANPHTTVNVTRELNDIAEVDSKLRDDYWGEFIVSVLTKRS